LSDSRWQWERLLSRRLFAEREILTASAFLIYRKRWTKNLPELVRKHAA